MSRTLVVSIVLVVVAAGVMFALGVFDGDDEPVATTGITTATESTIVEAGPTTTATPSVATTTGEDPLCVAYSELSAAVDGHLPVEDAGDLQTYQTANVAFYTEAVGHVDPPDDEAFIEMRDYQQAVYDWAEANDWSPTQDLADLAENPPPTVPEEAVSTVTQVLEDRCDVVPLVE